MSKEIILVTGVKLDDKDQCPPSPFPCTPTICSPNVPCAPNTRCGPNNCFPATRPCMPECAPAPSCSPTGKK